MGLEDVDSHMYTKKCQHQLLNYIYIQFLKINYLIKVGNKLIFKISQIEKKKNISPYITGIKKTMYHWEVFYNNTYVPGLMREHLIERGWIKRKIVFFPPEVYRVMLHVEAVVDKGSCCG